MESAQEETPGELEDPPLILKPGIAAALLAAAGLVVTDIAAEGGGPPIGRHACHTSRTGTFFHLFITGPNTYKNADGAESRYRYDPGSSRVVFESGPMAGYPATMMRGRIFIASRQAERPFYNIGCDFKP
jgi:hypothetical protein